MTSPVPQRHRHGAALPDTGDTHPQPATATGAETEIGTAATDSGSDAGTLTDTDETAGTDEAALIS